MNLKSSTIARFIGTGLLTVALLCCEVASAQVPGAPESKSATPTAPAAEQPALPEDSLGRTTPRGTVIGFLAAARKGDYQTAAEYLNARQRGGAALILAEQLAFVLDRRLPPRLNELSSEPQGSQSRTLQRGQELIGSIESENGTVDILLEQVNKGGKTVWLFSRATLAAIPDLYDEVSAISVETLLPESLLRTFLGIRGYTWLALFVGLPGLYAALSLLNSLLGAAAAWVIRKIRHRETPRLVTLIPSPLRLLTVAFTIRWLLARLSLPLLSRQFWHSLSIVLAITALVWLFVVLSKVVEKLILKRLARENLIGAATLVRPARTVINIMAAFVGLLFALYSFGVNLTAALAGLGVGGIAVALAAQKTLENMIGGASIIMDRAIRTGDFLKIGDILGTVEDVGLRSTRLRTLNRTLVSVPNSQMATMTLENFAFRDSFWFHHFLGLRFETTSAELSNIMRDIHAAIAQKVRTEDRSSLRVRLLGFGQSGYQVEVFAHLYAEDWEHFLELQESLLLKIVDIVQARGVCIERPSRTIYLAQAAEGGRAELEPLRKAIPSGG